MILQNYLPVIVSIVKLYRSFSIYFLILKSEVPLLNIRRLEYVDHLTVAAKKYSVSANPYT